jgi:hypothetical protein
MLTSTRLRDEDDIVLNKHAYVQQFLLKSGSSSQILFLFVPFPNPV